MVGRQLLSLPGRQRSELLCWIGCFLFIEPLSTNVGVQGQKCFVSRIVLELDSKNSDSERSANGSDIFEASQPFTGGEKNQEATLNDALRHTIYAYASRWLPLRSAFENSHPGSSTAAQRKQQDIQWQLWQKSRQYILSVLTRPSYRSILTLLLFTVTEMPLDTEDDGIGDLCSQTLFSHFLRLQSPFKPPALSPLSQSTTAVPSRHQAVDYSMPKERQEVDLKHQHLQDSMFWLGVLCDSSRSIVHSTTSVILPGRSGDKQVWNYIRQRTVIFDQSFRVLHGSPLPLSPDVIVVVLQHASACKTMYLGMLAQFSDAVFHYKTEPVDDAARRVAEESRRFHDVFDRLLAMCARDYLTMSRENQTNYGKHCTGDHSHHVLT